MSLYPEQTCVLCDLPWKNNRIRYDGCLICDYKPRALRLGQTLLTINREGLLTLQSESEPELRIQTDFPASEETIAFDALHRILYFASDRSLVAYGLETQHEAFRFATEGMAGAPTLFEYLLPTGQIQLAAGFGDGAGRYIAVDRVSGQLLWRAQILGNIADAAAHRNGYLYLSLRGLPLQALCLDTITGELVWWNRGKGEAQCGVIVDSDYCVQNLDGTWLRFSLEDGERLP